MQAFTRLKERLFNKKKLKEKDMNPFNNVEPTSTDEIVNKEEIKNISNKIKENINKKRLIIIEGDYGSGKSLYLKTIHDKLKSKNKSWNEFNKELPNKLKSLIITKNHALFIDNFDLISGLTNDELFNLTNTIMSLLEKAIIIISSRPENTKRLLRINPLLQSRTLRIKIKPLTLKETIKLVINRLNKDRKTRTNSLEPFTREEITSIWRKANGNPRLILLILKELYDKRLMN